MTQLRVDEHEPMEIVRLLEPAFDIDHCRLNAEGWADYYYTGEECYCHESGEYNIERKSWNDASGGIEEIEEQLANQLRLHPGVHHRLYWEGVAEPAPNGLLVYSKQPGQNAYRASLRGTRGAAYKSVRAWLKQVGKYWEVVYTPSMAGTAVQIGVDFTGDQVPEDDHKTFKRMFKKFDHRRDPMAERILGGAGDVAIGPERAEAIARHFGTPIRAWRASVGEWTQIRGIGEGLARSYLRGIGRGDV